MLRINHAARATARAALIWLAAAIAMACGPIDPVKKVKRPPYIAPDTVEPGERVIQLEELGDGTVTLEVTELYDPNDHDELFGIWLREQDAIDDVRAENKEGETRVINGDTYRVFEGMRVELDPCRAIRANNLKETVWLLVSDRRFLDFSTPTPDADAFLISHAWELSYSGKIISQCEQ